MKERKDPIAELQVVFQKPDGSRAPGRINVGIPFESEPGCWRCPAGIEGLHRLPDIAGGDSLQSLCLAIRLLQRLLADFKRSGGEIYVPAKDESGRPEEIVFESDLYFGQVRLDSAGN